MTVVNSKTASVAFVHGILRPLSELAHILGLSVAEVELALRYEFVRGALRRLTTERQRRVTFSDVAVVTGLHRRLVTQLLAHPRPRSQRSRPSVHRAARVLAAWSEERDYRGTDGRPKLLTMDGPHGFAELVRRYGGDVPPTAVLDALVRQGAVRVMKSGQLQWRGKAAASIDPEVLERGAEQVAQLLRALTHNLSSRDPGDQMYISDVRLDSIPGAELPLARRDARAALEPALDGLLRSAPKRIRRRAATSAASASLRALVCISTAAEAPTDPDKQPRRHQRPRRSSR